MAGLAGCSSAQEGPAPAGAAGETSAPSVDRTAAPTGEAEVVETYPRGPGFTQGLEVLDDGRLLHGTGRYGESRLEVMALGGAVETSADLPADEFGEGVTASGDGDTAYQLTWRSGVVHTWSLPDLEPGPELSIEGEGWGLCHDETDDVLWLSDGSAELQALDPQDLSVRRRVAVAQEGSPVEQLNELECVGGAVWANIWHSDEVVRIDPATGAVTARVDLSGVVQREQPADGEDVLNGLAYDRSDGTFLVTGKNWEHIYRVAIPNG